MTQTQTPAHTPGPYTTRLIQWRQLIEQADTTEYAMITRDGISVLALVPMYPDGNPDIALFKAAPALLAALKAITVIDTLPSGGVVIGPRGWELVLAAIQQAEGEA